MPLAGLTPRDKQTVAGAVLIGAGGSAIANLVTDGFKKNKRLAVLSTILMVSIGIAFMVKSLEG
jgi:hypothetical protein